MPRGKKLTDIEKGQILAYQQENVGVREISRRLERNHRVIQNFLKDPSKYGIKQRSGRKRIVSKRDQSRILREASNTTRSLNQIKHITGVEASKSTIWRVLNRCDNIKFAKMKMAPRLLKRHIEARVEFARFNMNRNWNMVVSIRSTK